MGKLKFRSTTIPKFVLHNSNFIYNSLRMECTLFGNYVDELNTFLSSGELQNVVISLQFAKVKIFQGMFTHETVTYFFIILLKFMYL